MERTEPESWQLFQIHSPGGSTVCACRPLNRLSAVLVNTPKTPKDHKSPPKVSKRPQKWNEWNEMKVQWFKVHSKAKSRLSLTVEQNKIVRWSESPCYQSCGKGKGLRGKDNKWTRKTNIVINLYCTSCLSITLICLSVCIPVCYVLSVWPVGYMDRLM